MNLRFCRLFLLSSLYYTAGIVKFPPSRTYVKDSRKMKEALCIEKARDIMCIMNFWKNWPYWLRGGVVGGGIVILSLTLGFSCLHFLISGESYGIECIPLALPWIPFWFVPNISSLPGISYEIILFITWFVIGSLVGLFIGYTKRNIEIGR